jgi:hypothetical protein
VQKSNPIFLLGVGRCGSTSLQVHLCRSSEAWIWGEHDGVLTGLFEWTSQVRQSKGLESFSTIASQKDALRTIQNVGQGDATHVAWMNQFSSKQLEKVERFSIESMFARRLPSGKSRWGFKEIRYGIGNRVPEELLRVYPNANIVHTVRHPFHTVESSIFAWHFDELEWLVSDGNLDAVRSLYGAYVARWVQAVEYFDRLRANLPKRVIFSQAETLTEDFPRLLDFLGLTQSEYVLQSTAPINGGERIADETNLVLREYLKLFRDEFRNEVTSAAIAAGYEI